MIYEHINYQISDHIATITLNQPDRLNALTPLMRKEFLDAMVVSDNDSDVRVDRHNGCRSRLLFWWGYESHESSHF